MARRKQTAKLIRAHAAHRRTEGDYMGALLDAVTLEDWRDVVDKLARPLIDRQKYPSLHADDGWQAQIRALVAAELAEKVRMPETIENPATARLSDESGG